MLFQFRHQCVDALSQGIHLEIDVDEQHHRSNEPEDKEVSHKKSFR